MNRSSSSNITLITGGNSGIGLALAWQCAQRGEKLVLIARDAETLAHVAHQISSETKVHVHTLALNLAEAEAITKVLQYLEKNQLTVETLINNAGFGDYGAVVDAEWSKLESMIALNITALTRLCRELTPKMKEQGSGRVLNVASLAGFLPGPLMAVYYASKAYVLSFSVALANELEPFGVTVSVLCPGATKSNFTKRADLKGSPLFEGRDLASAEAVAKAALAGLDAGKTVIIPGRRYALSAFFSRLIPLELAAKFARRAQEK